MRIQDLLGEFCDYSLYIRGYSKETVRRYRSAFNTFRKDMGITDLEEVNDETIRKFFLHGMTKRKWDPNTFVTYHKSFVVFFRWCIERRHMKSNPAEDIELPKRAKKLPSRLTKHEALKLLEYIYNYPYSDIFLRYRNHAIFSMFIFAGLRKQELLKLGYADVDLEGMSIFVRRGKGAKDRIIPICSRLAESLHKYLKQRSIRGRTCPEFFSSSTVNVGFSESGLRHLVRKVKRESEIKFGIHKLRHTFATLMLEGGCDIYSLSKMMGHSDIKTTTIYLAASAEHLRSQIHKHPMNSL